MQSLTAALLVLASGPDRYPWQTTQWEAITKTHGLPWQTDTDAPDKSMSKVVPEWTVRVAKSVETFVHNVWLKTSDEAQNKYVMSRQVDNDTTGRNTWAQWVSRAQRLWGLNAVIDDVLTTHGSAPRDILKTFQVKQVCNKSL